VKRVARFALVGSAGFVIDAGITELLFRWLDVAPIWARVPAFLLASMFTWWWNRSFTFGNKTAPSLAEWLKYLTIGLAGNLLNYLVFLVAIANFEMAQQLPSIAVAGGSIAAMFVNYIFSRRLLRFREPNGS
jgi:putative flippase GtrA